MRVRDQRNQLKLRRFVRTRSKSSLHQAHCSYNILSVDVFSPDSDRLDGSVSQVRVNSCRLLSDKLNKQLDALLTSSAQGFKAETQQGPKS